MISTTEQRELSRLLSALCDGPLSHADHARLESLMLAHPEALHEWLDLSRLEVEIELQVRAGLIQQRLSELVRRDANGETLCESSGGELCGTPPQQAQGETIACENEHAKASSAQKSIAARLLFPCLAVAAAFLLLAFGLEVAGWRSSATEPQVQVALDRPPTSQNQDQKKRDHRAKRRPEVAALLRESGGDGQNESQGAISRVLLAGEELEITTGQASLEMTGGANLYVEAPARMRFISPEHIRLFAGSMSAHLPEWAKGFTVDTNAMRIIDLGTTFAVTAEASHAAEAQVLQGMIKVQPREMREGDLKSFLLTEGEAIRVDGLKQRRSSVNLDDARVRERMEMVSTSESLQPIPTSNTGVALQVGEEDPFWRIVASPEGVRSPRYAVVCEPHFRYSSNEPERSQWISVNVANDPVPNDAIYTFATSIDATGYRADSIRVIGQVLADNGVREIRVNGDRIDMQEWINNFHGQEFSREEFHVVELDSGFREGVNVIEFDVWNGGEYRGEDTSPEAMRRVPNPMALRVEWQAFGHPLPQAHSVNANKGVPR